MDFEYIVVGNGLFGSAAARYLSEVSNSVAIIGPDEPLDHLNHDGVYASHYDERRLVRVLGRSKVRSQIGQMAMANYRMLEERSGISFHDPIGYLNVNCDNVESNNLESPREVIAELAIEHTLFSEGDQSWRQQFPDFDFPKTHWIIHEPAPAGLINPRSMLRAQNVIAEQQGTVIIRDIVENLHENTDFVEVVTRSGEKYRSLKVLVAVGSFTNCFDFFPQQLPVSAETEIFVLARVSTEEAARLSSLPALAYAIDDPVLQHLYMAPPVRYPDGNYYIKLGANTPTDYSPNSLGEIQEWFRRGNSDLYLGDFERVLRSTLPTVEFLSFETSRCILSRTPNKYPLIDQITERCYVASGAHGSGAKSADAIGRLAAGLVIDDQWHPEIPRELFQMN